MSVQTETLVSPQRLAQLIASEQCVVVDCRFDLVDVARGRKDYLAGHIPGAHYANLNEDLSSEMTATSGRHPLPGKNSFASFLSRIGWAQGKLLVAHDDRNNAIAARLWWLMRYFGKDSALLDGGLEAWTRSGLTLETGKTESVATSMPALTGNDDMIVSADDILSDIPHGKLRIIDARAAERYSGAVEPLDARAGHIPGALNRFLGLNLDVSGRFKPAQQLREEFKALLQNHARSAVVHSCGSGVTACHNQFAMELAGLTSTRVYPGSWSEWSRDESRPVETSV